MKKLSLSILFLFSLIYSFAQVTVVDPRTFTSDTTIQDTDETYGRPTGTNKKYLMKYIRKYVREGFSGHISVNAVSGAVTVQNDVIAWAMLTSATKDSIIAGKKRVSLRASKPSTTYLADIVVDTVGTDSIYIWNFSKYNLFTVGSGSGGVTSSVLADTAAAIRADFPSGSGITALTGDVTASGTGSVAATIANNAVDSTKAANLSPSDLAQTGASTGQVLTWTGSKYAPRPAIGGGASPGGSNTQLQYNNSGSFAGNANATYDGSTVSVRALNLKLDTTDSRKIIFSSLDAGTGNAGIWYNKARLPDRQSRPNEVISLGFNWDNSSTGDNSNIRLGIERHYMPFPGAGYYWQEFHAPEVRLTGGEVFRPASWEGRKDIKSGTWTYRADSYNFQASDNTYLLSFSKEGGFTSTATATSSSTWRFLNSEATKEINWNIGADGTAFFNATTGSQFVFQKPMKIETGITGSGLNILSNFTGSNALTITGAVTGSSTPLDVSVSSSTGLQGLLYNTSSATNAKTTMTLLATGSNADASLFFGNTSVEYWSFGLDATDGRVKINSNASDPSSGTNHFLVTNTGRVGIGGVNSQNPTARLHLPAGTATANTAPFKFTSGTNLTTAEAGAVEYDGTEFYATNSTASRTILARVLKGSATLDFPDTASGSSSSLTITVTGAATTDSGVSIQRDNASISGTFYEAVITGPNTVTVYFHNFSGSNQDPAPGTFRPAVTK